MNPLNMFIGGKGENYPRGTPLAVLFFQIYPTKNVLCVPVLTAQLSQS